MAKRPVAIGRTWFASLDGERLACVHEHWLGPDGIYRDPNGTPGMRQFDEYVSVVRNCRKVILTRSKIDDPVRGFGFHRKGYLSVLKVEDVQVNGNELTFRVVPGSQVTLQ